MATPKPMHSMMVQDHIFKFFHDRFNRRPGTTKTDDPDMILNSLSAYESKWIWLYCTKMMELTRRKPFPHDFYSKCEAIASRKPFIHYRPKAATAVGLFAHLG